MDKDQAFKVHNKDKDQTCKDKDKHLKLVFKESLRTVITITDCYI